MATYALRSGSATLVEVRSSSSLDNPDTRATRRGTVFRTLQGIAIQYAATVVGEDRIVWNIPVVNPHQEGVLYSASIGVYGSTLTFVSPVYGGISVAFEPGPDGFVPERHAGSFGKRIVIRFVRLT